MRPFKIFYLCIKMLNIIEYKLMRLSIIDLIKVLIADTVSCKNCSLQKTITFFKQLTTCKNYSLINEYSNKFALFSF